MEFERVHWLGSKHAKKPRPIVAKFHRYKQRETVRTKSQDENTKQRLKAEHKGVGVQTPYLQRMARKELLPIAREEERKGHRTRIKANKLYVNDILKKKYVDGEVIDCAPQGQ